jgi:hypothetical protein
MARRKQKEVYLMAEPKWAQLKACKTLEDQTALYRKMEYFVHYEVGDKKTTASMRKWLETESGFAPEVLAKLKKVPDVWFFSFGKACFIWEKTGVMLEEMTNHLVKKVPDLCEKAEELIEKEADKKADAKPKISIQQRMRDQVENLMGEWEGYLDQLVERNFDLKKWEPYKEMQAFGGGVIKPNHAKIIKDDFADAYLEALEILEWTDEDIKEAYSHMDAKDRKAFVAFYDKINIACDTFIQTGKATRKTRKPKQVSKEKLVSKLKFQINDSVLGVASINPAEMIDAVEIWVYNTKTRKVGVYKADDRGAPLTVKGTTLQNFDEKMSIQKTLRKPAEQIKNWTGNAKTKFNKAFAEIKTTDTKMNGRFNDTTIILKAF